MLALACVYHAASAGTNMCFMDRVGCTFLRERILNTSRPGEMQVTIQSLMPDSKYKFRVVAHNRNGLGETSAVLKVATQAEGEATYTHTHTPT